AQGFGLRAVSGEATGYAHSSMLSEQALLRACDTVKAVRSGHGGHMSLGSLSNGPSLYTDLNPLALVPFETKVELLENIDAYARGRDSRVVQVMASVLGSWQAVRIVRADGRHASDIRPL